MSEKRTPKEDERTPGLDDLPDALDFLSEINAHSGAWCFMYEGEDGNSWTQGSTAPDQAAASVCSLREALSKSEAELARLTADNDCGPWKSTRPMRVRAAELARAGSYMDDYDRAVLAILEDFERLERLHVANLKAALKGVPQPATPKEAAMTEAQIKHMVDRFLSWKLPDGFHPDGGISFKRTFNEHTAHPGKHEPTGTNLFCAEQATAMVRHMLEGLPATEVDADQDLDPRTPEYGVGR